MFPVYYMHGSIYRSVKYLGNFYGIIYVVRRQQMVNLLKPYTLNFAIYIHSYTKELTLVTIYHDLLNVSIE